jgi:uncharacterized protein (TIGR02172 family)
MLEMEKGQIVGVGRTAEIMAWDANRVLKLFHEGWSLSEAKREEKIARIIFDAGLPVPAVHEIIKLRGRYGILYDRIEGQSMLKELMSTPSKLRQYATLFAHLHMRIHSVQVKDLPSQHQKLRRKICRAKSLPYNLKQETLRFLQDLPDSNMLCHGDFHPENILMSNRGPIVIDWIDATIGKPEADIARTLILVGYGKPAYPNFNTKQLHSTRSQFIRTYLKEYMKLHPKTTIEEIKLWRIPVAAARLDEDIKEEEDKLLSIIRNSLTSIRGT